MPQLTNENIEELRNYFSPGLKTVTSLPDPASAEHGARVILTDGRNELIYVMHNGGWKKEGTLNGLTAEISFTDNSSVQNTITIVNGIITNWTQT